MVEEQPNSKNDPRVVALIGNPNTGKTTLFNRLTGVRQRVGNYPGVTVEKREGKMVLNGRQLEVVDLPGTYSLSASSTDEQVVVDFLSGHLSGKSKPDVIVCVVDATNLNRNLYLASQAADTDCPIVIALNMFDEADAQGLEVDPKILAANLGVPVVPVIATKGDGVEELKAEIVAAFDSERRMERVGWPRKLAEGLNQLEKELAPHLTEPLSAAEVQRLFFDRDSIVAKRLPIPKRDLADMLERSRADLSDSNEGNFAHLEPSLRYQWIAEKTTSVLNEAALNQTRFSDSLDAVLTHRAYGMVVFFAVVYFVFQSIYSFAAPFMGLIEGTFAALGNSVTPFLESTPMIQSLVVDGVIAGVGGVLVFLPQILVLFLFISILEDSGYMARAAFLMDKVFGWCGLNGKSFVPLISSYACAVPGVMAARTIEDPKSRLITILIAPLMSCSARLPVYVLMIGAFIEPVWGASWAGFTLFAMHFLGLFVAIPIAFLFHKVLFLSDEVPFILEMPPYRVPQVRDVLWRVWERSKHFLVRAGTVIFCMSILIWALSYFPHASEVESLTKQQFVSELAATEGLPVAEAEMLLSDKNIADKLDRITAAQYMEGSYLGRFGKFVQPIFAPAGFDWKITVGVLASFPAREVIISTLGILYNLGGDVTEGSSELMSSMRHATRSDGAPVFTPLVAIGIMVFFALCMQCGATVAVIAQESAWKWALFAFAYMTILAWTGAVLVHQVGSYFLS